MTHHSFILPSHTGNYFHARHIFCLGGSFPERMCLDEKKS
jgi:hypothetical protein